MVINIYSIDFIAGTVFGILLIGAFGRRVWPYLKNVLLGFFGLSVVDGTIKKENKDKTE